MNQKRMVHSTVWSSGQVSRLSLEARLLYIGLITIGDDDGRLKANPALIRSQLFPYDTAVTIDNVKEWLKEIEAQKLILGYCVDDECFFYHPKWENYQHIREDRRKDSNIPAPTFEFSPMATTRQPTGNQSATKRPHSIVKDSIVKVSIDTIEQDKGFQVFWEKYPRKTAKKAAYKSWSHIKWTPELHKKIIDSLDAFAKSEQWIKDSGRYIPHPASWLNGERWEDEITVGRARTNKYEKVSRTA